MAQDFLNKIEEVGFRVSCFIDGIFEKQIPFSWWKNEKEAPAGEQGNGASKWEAFVSAFLSHTQILCVGFVLWKNNKSVKILK